MPDLGSALPVLAGLLAATGWSVSNLASRRAALFVGTPSTVALSTTIGLAVLLPLLATEPPPALDAADLALLAGAGFGGAVGLVVAYRAYRIGQVALVAPVLSSQGAVAAVLAVLAGERLAPLTAATLAVVAAGVVLVAVGSRTPAASSSAPSASPSSAAHHAPPLVVLGWATLATLLFGTGMFSTGRLAGELPLAWAALPSRLVGAAILLVPLAASGRLRTSRAALPTVLLVALTDLGAILVFSIGAREAPAVASVFGSQVAVISVLLAFLFDGERPGRLQLAGLAVVAIGATVLALVRP